MNSRQTYDEEEMLRKAIEESKGGKDDNGGSRKGKRNRDESEEYVNLVTSRSSSLTLSAGTSKTRSVSGRTQDRLRLALRSILLHWMPMQSPTRMLPQARDQRLRRPEHRLLSCSEKRTGANKSKAGYNREPKQQKVDKQELEDVELMVSPKKTLSLSKY